MIDLPSIYKYLKYAVVHAVHIFAGQRFYIISSIATVLTKLLDGAVRKVVAHATDPAQTHFGFMEDKPHSLTSQVRRNS